MTLERDLRQALQRREPGPRFADDVVSRIERSPSSSAEGPSRRARIALPLAASILLGLGGGFYVYRQNVEIRMEEMQTRNAAEVAHALRIASEKASRIQTRYQEISRHDP